MIVTRNRKKRGTKKSAQSSAGAVGQYASDAWSLAKRTAVGLNEIRKLINIETKFCDAVLTSSAQDTTGSMFPLSELAQGLTSTTRVGDSIKIQHIEIRGRVAISASATNSLIRVMVVRDLDGYGTSPTPADVLELNAAVSAPLSPVKYRNRQRFSVLYDELFALQSATSQGQSSYPFYFSTPHQGHVLYLGTTAAAASDGKGSVYVVTCSDESTNKPSIAYYSRILFTDD